MGRRARSAFPADAADDAAPRREAPRESFAYSTRDDFERLYSNVGGANYVWFQFRLQLEASALFDRAGPAAVTRLFETFRLDDAALARRLDESVDHGLAEFSLAF